MSRILASLFLLVGIVVSPLRAGAASVPMLIAYDVAVHPTATAAPGGSDAVRPQRGGRPEYAYDAVHVGYDGAANRQGAARAGAADWITVRAAPSRILAPMTTTNDSSSTWPGARAVLPNDAPLPPGFSSHTAEFLRAVGLPRAVKYGSDDLPARVSFARLERGLVPVERLLPPRVLPSAQWRAYLVLGEERFEGGASPLWCVHSASGQVAVIDVEAEDDSLRFVNSDVGALTRSFVTLLAWARKGAQSIDALSANLERADQAGWPRSRWRVLLDNLDTLTPSKVICEPLSDG